MNLTRRDLAVKVAAAAGLAAIRPARLDAQAQGTPVPAPPARNPPSVISTPPRDFSPGAPPVTYPDPDVITIDPAFNALRLGNTPIQRLWTGVVCARPVPRLERHPEQPSAALSR
jgi:gluconolactonase